MLSPPFKTLLWCPIILKTQTPKNHWKECVPSWAHLMGTAPAYHAATPLAFFILLSQTKAPRLLNSLLLHSLSRYLFISFLVLIATSII